MSSPIPVGGQPVRKPQPPPLPPNAGVRPTSGGIGRGTILSLSLLNDRFSATAVHRGSVASTWERPEPLTDLADFAAVLREAAKQTGYAGTQATVVIAHPRLAQQLVEAPPIKGRNLRLFLQRRVKELKPFPAEAAWSYQPALPTRNAAGLLVHFFPQPMLDQLTEGCAQADLQLVRAIPASAILQRQLPALPLEPNEVAVLAAETGGNTTVVIGRKDGQIYLSRTLGNSWNAYADRVNVDLNRTILYVKQQFGATVGSLWLFGPGAENQLVSMRTTLRLPVKLSPVAPSPSYWGQEALRVPVDDTSNLISTEQLQAPRRRAFLRAVSVIVGLLAVGAVATAGAVQMVVRDRAKQYQALQSKVQQVQERRVRLQERERQFLQQKEFVKVVQDDKVRPVPGWFLGHLGNQLPEELLLQQYRLHRDGDLWRVELNGTLQPTPNPAPAAVLAKATATLKSNLTAGPFHVRVLNGDRTGAAPAAASPTSRTATPAGALKFSVEGTLDAVAPTNGVGSKPPGGSKP